MLIARLTLFVFCALFAGAYSEIILDIFIYTLVLIDFSRIVFKQGNVFTLAIFLGWLVPFAISNAFPLTDYILSGSYTSITLSAKCFVLLLYFILDFTSILYFSRRFKRENLKVFILSQGMILIGYAIAHITFIFLSFSSGFKYPIFSGLNLVDDAQLFFNFRGSATFFSLGMLFSFIYRVRMGMSRQRLSYFFLMLDLLYIIENTLYAKRMGIFLLLFGWIIIWIITGFLRLGKAMPRRAFIRGGLGLIVVLSMLSFVRLGLSYEEYFTSGPNVLLVDSLEQFLLFQPVLYMVPNFYNLSDLLSSTLIENFGIIDESLWGSVQSRPWNMRTFLGDNKLGVYFDTAILIAILRFSMYHLKWCFSNEKSVVILAIVLPRMLLLFTGNLFHEIFWYFIFIILVIPLYEKIKFS